MIIYQVRSLGHKSQNMLSMQACVEKFSQKCNHTVVTYKDILGCQTNPSSNTDKVWNLRK